MQINTPEAMQKAFELLQQYGSWEEVERVTGATQHSIDVLIGSQRNGGSASGKPHNR